MRRQPGVSAARVGDHSTRANAARGINVFASWPGLSRPSRLGGQCASLVGIAGSSPAMTKVREARHMMAEGSRLGRGLAALIGDVGDEAGVLERQRSQRRVPIEFVRPNPRNPRRAFAEADLDELAASIRERGIIQPILVRTVRGAIDQYEIVAGERRWRAAQRAGLHDVPVLLLEVSDKESLELAIIENVQRADLNPLEEANGYASLAEE